MALGGRTTRAHGPGDGDRAGLQRRRHDREALANPELIANRVLLSEGRLTVELPVARVRARGAVRLARIETITEAPNRRTSIEGGLLMPLGDVRPAVLYRVTQFARASTAGYFAPKRVETVDAGGYWESSGEGAVSLAVDAGGGLQRAFDAPDTLSTGGATGPGSGRHGDMVSALARLGAGSGIARSFQILVRRSRSVRCRVFARRDWWRRALAVSLDHFGCALVAAITTRHERA
jgi:hypothetical protein